MGSDALFGEVVTQVAGKVGRRPMRQSSRCADRGRRRCRRFRSSAQVDLTGTWQRVGQNDNGASQEPVDLLGMPLSADGRAKALSYDIAALSATERQCQMYPPFYALVGPFPLQFVMVPDPVTQKLLAWKIAGVGRSRRDGDLDGRTAASVEVRAALARRLHHRRVGRRHADRRHHALQARRHQAPPRLQQRPGDAHLSLQPARRPADRHRHPRGPRVSGGAVRADRGLPPDDQPEQLPADGVRADRGAAAPARESGARSALPAWQASVA